METSIVGVGVGITDRFRSVVEEKAARIQNLAPRAQRVDVKVTHRAYHNGRMEDETVELTVNGRGPVIRAEATDGDTIAVLEQGRLLDLAPHSILLDRCAEYRHLWQQQNRGR